jgi:hypothetical protein
MLIHIQPGGGYVKIRLLVVPLLLFGAVLAASVPLASAQTPGPLIDIRGHAPSAGTKLAGDLINPGNMKFGPDGMIYVAENGNGGSTAYTAPDGTKFTNGTTGRISKIDPATGTRTTVVDGLPSNGGNEGATGPADVAFLNGQLYYVQSHGGAFYGFPGTPTGLYKVNTNGTTKLVADIGKFNIDHPVAPIVDHTQQDIEVGGNPYALTVRDGMFLEVDGNQNQVLQITSSGVMKRLAEFPTHVVSTGIATASSGPLYVGTLGQFPFSPDAGRVYQVGYPSGNLIQIASGVSSITDVELGPGGQLYAVSFGAQGTDPNGAPWMPFSAQIMKVDASTGTFVPLVRGFSFSTSLVFNGDTAYIINDAVDAFGPGEIWQIPNFSSITPLPAAAPVATQPKVVPATTTTLGGAITAPNTGTGSTAGGADETRLWLLVVIAGVLGVATVCGGSALARKWR